MEITPSFLEHLTLPSPLQGARAQLTGPPCPVELHTKTPAGNARIGQNCGSRADRVLRRVSVGVLRTGMPCATPPESSRRNTLFHFSLFLFLLLKDRYIWVASAAACRDAELEFLRVGMLFTLHERCDDIGIFLPCFFDARFVGDDIMS